MSELCFKQARPHIWKGKCCFTALIFYPSASVDGLAIAVTTSLGNKIVYAGRNDSDHRQGVAIMMSKALNKSMLAWTPISERLMVAIFKSRH